jgi:hypothetical protein
MPDMDKSWNKVRDKLPEFIALARKFNATDIVPTSQALILAELSPDSGGWCFGLSMAYIIGMARGDSAASIIGNGYQAAGFAAGKTDQTRIGQWTGNIRNYHSRQHAEYQVSEDVGQAGLITSEWNTEYSDYFGRFGKVAKGLVSIGTGYALVNSPNHSMAAAVGRTFSFYDPNFGSVTFATAQQFQDFFVAWFDKDFIQRSYKGTAGGAKNGPPAKSLVIKLCVFQAQRQRSGGR